MVVVSNQDTCALGIRLRWRTHDPVECPPTAIMDAFRHFYPASFIHTNEVISTLVHGAHLLHTAVMQSVDT